MNVISLYFSRYEGLVSGVQVDMQMKINPALYFGAGNKMIDLYVNLAMPFNSFLVVVIYIIEIPSFYSGNAT